ncbi:hypothetical protein ACMHYB_30520 [Sorangium sp. So ce1128]
MPANGRRLPDRLTALFDRIERPLRRALFAIATILTVALLVAMGILCANGPNDRGTRTGWGSDHLSHLSTPAFFARTGLRIYTTRSADLCRKPQRIARNPAYGRDGCGDLFVNWQRYPRVYPPLNLLYHLPVALLRGTAILSEPGANLAIVFQYLAAAAVLLILLARWMLLEGNAHPLLAFGLWAILAQQAWIHTSNGFYDGVAVLGVCAAIRALYPAPPAKPASERALLFYALGFGLHYRALWYLPVGAAAALPALRRSLRGESTPGDRHRLAAAIAIGAAAGLTLLLLLPHLGDFPVNNAYFWRNPWPPEWKIDAALIAVLLALGVRAEAGVLYFAVIAWLFPFLTQVREVMIWHSLFLIPFAFLLTRMPKRLANLGIPITVVLFTNLFARPFHYSLFSDELVNAVCELFS